MKIIKLILHGYKRLFLNNLDHIEYTPESNIQLILGSNGSGKSCLLSMLNPNPADIKRDFREDGYKYIEIEHNNNLYVLSSGYVDKNKHSFLFNNIELNQGGTKKVQSMLVLEHFKITPAISNILLGISNFTTMGPQDRKHWFTELSTIDYTFPISVYNKLKQRHRDILGGIKLVQEELIKAETLTLSLEDIENLKKDRDMLEEYINHCLSIYNHNVTDYEEDKVLDLINETNLTLSKYLESVPENIKLEYVKKKVITLKERNNILLERNSQLLSDLNLLDKIKQNDKSIDVLLKEKDNLLDYLTKLDSNNFLELDLNNINNILNGFNQDYPDMISLINSLIQYDNIDVNKEAVNLIIKNKTDLEIRIRSLNDRLVRVSNEIEEMKNHKHDDNKVICDKCNHSWFFKYDENKLISFENDRVKIIKELETTNNDYKNILNLLENIQEKLNIIQSIKALTYSRGDTKNIWLYVFKNNSIYTTSGIKLGTEIEKIKSILVEYINYSNKKQELVILDSKIKIANEINEAKSKLNNAQASKLEEELHNNTKQLNELNEDIKKYSKYEDTLIKIDSLFKTLNILLKKRSTGLYITIARRRNRLLGELVSALKTHMVDISQTINTAQQIEYKKEQNNNLLKDYKTKEKVLNILVKELSPNEGIIAKSMNSFLNVFISEMNHIINSVWTYSMILLPCEVTEENDLNYQFMVKVNDDEIIEDISKLSSSMQEIVNLAFKIVFVKYMGIPDTPLFLDEFGRTMDPAHRISAYNIVDNILQSSFSQIYIVSHFESMYGRFGNADISVLDSSNLDLARDINYNTVLKIN